MSGYVIGLYITRMAVVAGQWTSRVVMRRERRGKFSFLGSMPAVVSHEQNQETGLLSVALAQTMDQRCCRRS
jgi:hypothetical protein